MATTMRKLAIYIFFVSLYALVMMLLKYISFLFDHETRARILRFRTTIFIWTFSVAISVYVWTNLSSLFDSDIFTKADQRQYSFDAVSKKWISLKLNEKVWRTVLLTILVLGNCSYSSFSFFLSSDPYTIVIIFFLSFALTILLFSGLVLMKLFTLLGTFFGCFSERIIKKYKRIQLVIVVIFAAFVSSVGYYNSLSLPQIKKLTIPVKDLPEKLNGLTITFIPDIHIGPTVGRTRLEQVINMVNYLQSDLVVIGGDLVDGPVNKLEAAVEPLEWIKSKYGTYFVTGNHEYYTVDVHNWMKKLASLGVRVLLNENVHLPSKEDKSLCLAGVSDPVADEYMYEGHTLDLDKALGRCDPSKPVILIAHRPQTAKLALESNHRVDLVLSGHTHGGQFFPITIGAYLLNPYFAGLYKHGVNSHVYVSMGTIYGIFPVIPMVASSFLLQLELTCLIHIMLACISMNQNSLLVTHQLTYIHQGPFGRTSLTGEQVCSLSSLVGQWIASELWMNHAAIKGSEWTADTSLRGFVMHRLLFFLENRRASLKEMSSPVFIER